VYVDASSARQLALGVLTLEVVLEAMLEELEVALEKLETSLEELGATLEELETSLLALEAIALLVLIGNRS
jgi:phage shock protein A